MEFTILVLGVGVVVSVVRIRISMRGTNNKKNKKIRVLNLSSIAIKHKKYQMSINERTKN